MSEQDPIAQEAAPPDPPASWLAATPPAPSPQGDGDPGDQDGLDELER